MLKKKMLLAVGCLALIAVVWRFRQEVQSIVMALFFSAAFTLLLAPVCARLERKGLSSSLAAGIAVGAFVLMLIVLISSFIPYLIMQSIALVRRIAPMALEILQDANGFGARFGFADAGWQNVSEMIAFAISAFSTSLGRAGIVFAAQAGRIAFALVIAYYFLRERKKFCMHLLLMIPIHWRKDVLSMLSGCKNAVLGYLSGVLKTSGFVCAATYVGLKLLGVEHAFLLSMFMGLFELIPYIGPVIAAVPILLNCLAQGVEKTLLAFLLLVLIQQIEGNFVGPHFTASSTSIHPLAVLLSVFVFGSLMGIWGIMIAVPVVVTIRSVVWSFRQIQER